MYTSAWWITTSYSSCTCVAAYNDSLLLYGFLELLEWWYNFCLHILQIDDLYHNSASEYYCNTALLIRNHCTLGLISVYDTENFNQALTSQVPMMPHIKNKMSPEAGQVGESVHCELIWDFLPCFVSISKDPYSPEGPGRRLSFSPTRAYFDPFTPLGSSSFEPSCKSTHALANVLPISRTTCKSFILLILA